MSARDLRIYPFLFAAFPALRLAADHPGEWLPSDLLTILAVTIGCVGVLYGLVWVVARRRVPAELIGLIVLTAVGWFFFYAPIYLALRSLTDHAIRHRQQMPVLAILTVAAVWWLARRPRVQQRVGRAATLTGLILVSLAVLSVVRAEWAGSGAVHASATIRELEGPIPGVPAGLPRAPASAPDIYLIVLDEYAGSAVLRDQFGFDNRPFLDSLRALGFVVPSEVRANYITTTFSLPSLLNFSHVNGIAREGLASTERDRDRERDRVRSYLVENNRAIRLLKSMGYALLFFPSTWWMRTASNRHADLQFDASGNSFDLRRAITRTELRRAYRAVTLLNLILPPSRDDPAFVRRTFAGLRSVPDRPGPTFALAHLMLPHSPFILDSACRPQAEPMDPGQMDASADRDPALHRMYVEQVQCTNRLVLDLVRHLVRRSPKPPIILLTADHGTYTLGILRVTSLAAITPAQARERLIAFGAYYLPNGGARVIPDTLTLVNLLPRVFNYYFGTAIPLSPDESYISHPEQEFLFARSPWPPAPSDRADTVRGSVAHVEVPRP